ncbi:lipase 1 [Actinoplanes sp. NBRC 14428]|uniref:Lysophospholipase L1-like esterase n=1 Tax=Pseudosporangium ferrugineum TaxID=439699 RepID=A0A2T0RQK9_9ACTN|nr:SGNH/GDSL hydrolase family protein [Pseudosporangium ferrugineum]PRY23441.1 lysophospholipase L1-like esterase [Pseudosporangium ferrugineum]BCJ55444.1 lipase 1 [Actinoplanes sp. NBRC 14428]
MSRRTTVLACLVSSILLTVATAAPAAAATPASEWDYVALGDSYSSGVGAPGQSGTCLRSPNAYPGLWNAANHPATYRSVACSGATTGSLRSSQLSALNQGTDLVTVTIGGNDVGFASTIITCTLSSDSGCAAKVDEALEMLEDEMPATFDATYREIRGKAPNARVVVLGYPILFDETAPSCGFAGMSIPKRKSINKGAAELNKVIKARSQAAGFIWSDVTDEFAGHGICGPSAWLHGLTLIPPTDSFHPTSNGYKYGYLPALNSVLP